MSRLWKSSMAFGLAGAVAMTDSLRFGRSMWPAVALFVLAGLLACVAAFVDAAAESARREAELDKQDASGAFRRELGMLAEHVEKHGQQIDHLQKKDALNALG